MNSWCMRMEAKNSYFKRIALVGRNFKNVPHTVSRRHQRLLCAYLQVRSFFSYNDLECGPCKLPATHAQRNSELRDVFAKALL